MSEREYGKSDRRLIEESLFKVVQCSNLGATRVHCSGNLTRSSRGQRQRGDMSSWFMVFGGAGGKRGREWKEEAKRGVLSHKMAVMESPSALPLRISFLSPLPLLIRFPRTHSPATHTEVSFLDDNPRAANVCLVRLGDFFFFLLHLGFTILTPRLSHSLLGQPLAHPTRTIGFDLGSFISQCHRSERLSTRQQNHITWKSLTAL